MQKSKVKSSLLAPDILKSKLCHVLGCSSTGPHNFTLNPQNGNLFTLCGNMCVETSAESNKQVSYLISDRHPINCFILGFGPTESSEDLIIGEGIGKKPSLYRCSKDGSLIKWRIHPHRFGVSQLFSSSSIPLFISIGCESDKSINFISKGNGEILYSSTCKQILIEGCFSDCRSYFIGIGRTTLTIWNMPFLKEAENSKAKLMSSSRILKWNEISIENEKEEVELVDVKWINSVVYVLTRGKKLLLFSQKCVFQEEIVLSTPKCNCFELFEGRLYIGCNNGKVIVFDLESKSILRELPRPLPLHNYNFDPINLTPNPSFQYPHICCLRVDEKRKRLFVLKSDSTIFVWDLSNLFKLSLRRSALNHCKGVIGMIQHHGAIITLGVDLTARVWTFFNEGLSRQENPFCKYLYRILHLNNDPSPFKGLKGDQSLPSVSIKCSTAKDNFLFIGDSLGTISVFAFLGEETFQCPLKIIKAHTSEVTCLSLTPESADSSLGVNMMASGSRDRKIKILDCSNDLTTLCEFEDFLCTVISVRFVFCAAIDVLQLLSVGSDKSIVVREYRPTDFNFFVKVKVEIERVEKILSCIVNEASSEAYFIYERRIKGWSIEELKLKAISETNDKSYTQVNGGVGVTLLAIACSDKNVRIRSKFTGAILCTISVGETISSTILCEDDNYLFTSSFEGSTVLWEIMKRGAVSRFRRNNNRFTITFEADEIYVEQESLEDSLEYSRDEFDDSEDGVIDKLIDTESKFVSNLISNNIETNDVGGEVKGGTCNLSSILLNESLQLKQEDLHVMCSAEKDFEEPNIVENRNSEETWAMKLLKKNNFMQASGVSNKKNGQESLEFSKASPSQRFCLEESSEIIVDEEEFNEENSKEIYNENQEESDEETKIDILPIATEVAEKGGKAMNNDETIALKLSNPQNSELFARSTIKDLKSNLQTLDDIRVSLDPLNSEDSKLLGLIEGEISQLKCQFSSLFSFSFGNQFL